MSRPAGSQHLSVLVNAGLVDTTPTGRQRWHELRTGQLYAAHAWLGELIATAEAAALERTSTEASVRAPTMESEPAPIPAADRTATPPLR